MGLMIFAAWSEIVTDDVNNSTAKSFRQEQCEARNGYQSDAKGVKTFVEWVPKYAGVLPGDVCKLTCRAKGTGYYVVFSQKVMASPIMISCSSLEVSCIWEVFPYNKGKEVNHMIQRFNCVIRFNVLIHWLSIRTRIWPLEWDKFFHISICRFMKNMGLFVRSALVFFQ